MVRLARNATGGDAVRDGASGALDGGLLGGGQRGEVRLEGGEIGEIGVHRVVTT
jgi:hypothetical protein